jgi:MFS family permease
MADARPEAAGAFQRWYVVVILALIYAMTNVDRLVVSVIVEPLKAELHLSDSQISILLGLGFSVPFGLVILPIGWIVDRANRRYLLTSILFVWSLLTGCCALATNFFQLVLLRAGTGAAEAGQSPTSLSLLGDAFPADQRSTAVGVYSSGVALGSLIVFLCGGWVLLHFGWRAVFLIAGIPGLILALLMLFTVPELQRGAFDSNATARNENTTIWNGIRWMAANPPLRHTLWAHTLAIGAQFTMLVWSGSLLVRVHGMTAPHASMAVGLIFGIAQALAAILIGPVSDRFARGTAHRLALVPAVGAIAALVSSLAMVFAPTLPTALLGATLLALAAGTFVGPSYALLVLLSPPARRGSTTAMSKLMQMTIGSGGISLLAGSISDLVGGPFAIRIALAVTALAYAWAAVHYFLASSNAQRIEAAAGIGPVRAPRPVGA